MGFWEVVSTTVVVCGLIHFFIISPRLHELREQFLRLKRHFAEARQVDGVAEGLQSLSRKYEALRQEVSELNTRIEQLSSSASSEKAQVQTQRLMPPTQPDSLSTTPSPTPLPPPTDLQPPTVLPPSTPLPSPVASIPSPFPSKPSVSPVDPSLAVPALEPQLEHTTLSSSAHPGASIPMSVKSRPPRLKSRPSSPQPGVAVPATTSTRQPMTMKRVAGSTSAKKAGALFDLEETLGTNWLLKIGMALVVVCMALFLGYSIQRLGPWGKVTVGIGVSLATIVGGWRIERRKDYETFGRVLLSGGWGLAYFTAYAMRYVEATRVLSSDEAGFFAMLLVAAGMVAQSLKYHSQFVTGFAYGLAYLTLVISPVKWHTLMTSAVLALSIVIILRQLGWYALESIAVISTYAIHFVWLHPIIAPMGNHKQFFLEYRGSVALLTLYWLIFTVSHFLRRGENKSQDKLLQFALILNALGYIGVSGYQSINPKLAFGFFLVLGLVYLVLAYFSRRLNRRGSYLLTSTIGAILVVAAIPYKFSSGHLAFLWLLECEMFLISGYRLREIHFRRLAWLTSAVLAGYLGYHDILPRFIECVHPQGTSGSILLTCGLAFILNTLFLGRKYKSEVKTALEGLSLDAYLHTGWLLLILAMWCLTQWEWLVLVWLAFGILLYEAHRWLGRAHLNHLAHLTVGLAIVRAGAVNLPYFFNHRGWGLVAGLMAGVVILLYLFSENFRREPAKKGIARRPAARAFEAYSYIAWGILLATSWLVLPWGWLCVGFAVGSCLWHVGSIGLGERRLRIQAQFTAMLAVLRFEFATAWVAAGWAIVSVALVILGRSISVEAFRVQSTFVTLLVLGRCVFENLSLPNEAAWINLRLASTASVITTFMLGFVLAKLLPKSDRNLASIHRGHKMASSYGTEDLVLTEKGVTAVARAGSIRRALRACDQSAHHFFLFGGRLSDCLDRT